MPRSPGSSRRAGRVAIASQSGGIGLGFCSSPAHGMLGISTFVSLGNKADVSGNDLLQWGESDPARRPSSCSIWNRSAIRAALRSSRAVSVARSRSSSSRLAGHLRRSRAAGSHTAGLASNERAVDALFKQSGVIRADTIDEMFDIAQCLDLQPLPAGRGVGIITNAGGPGILAADACEAAGLSRQAVRCRHPRRAGRLSVRHASVGNPVDLVASAGPTHYEHAIVTLLPRRGDRQSPRVVHTNRSLRRPSAILAAIGRGRRRAAPPGLRNKPVLACTLSAGTQPAPLSAGAGSGFPLMPFPRTRPERSAASPTYAQLARGAAVALLDVRRRSDVDEARALCPERSPLRAATRG